MGNPLIRRSDRPVFLSTVLPHVLLLFPPPVLSPRRAGVSNRPEDRHRARRWVNWPDQDQILTDENARSERA